MEEKNSLRWLQAWKKNLNKGIIPYMCYVICCSLPLGTGTVTCSGMGLFDHGHTSTGTVVWRPSTRWKLCCDTCYVVRCNTFCMLTFVRRGIAGDGVSCSKILAIQVRISGSGSLWRWGPCCICSLFSLVFSILTKNHTIIWFIASHCSSLLMDFCH